MCLCTMRWRCRVVDDDLLFSWMDLKERQLEQKITRKPLHFSYLAALRPNLKESERERTITQGSNAHLLLGVKTPVMALLESR